MTANDPNDQNGLPELTFLVRLVVGVSILVYGSLFILASTHYLNPARHPVRTVLASAGLITITAASGFWYLSGKLHGLARHILILLTLFVTVLMPLSAIWPGTITHGSFGWTVIGAQPVPGFDVVVPVRGAPWFHYKDHSFHPTDLRPVARHARVVVIGTGWQEGARVPPDVEEDVDARVIAKSTGEAIKTYNRLLNQGYRVGLLLHTTS